MIKKYIRKEGFLKVVENLWNPDVLRGKLSTGYC